MKYVAWLAVALVSVVAATSAVAETKPTNVVLFLVDDMGWQDCGVYGSQYYETPNIDRLATRGMRFTDFYSANPLCSPTRASILTGLYPARIGITTPAGHLPPRSPDEPRYPAKAAANQPLISPNSLTYLDPEYYTLAEALRDAGYRTGHFGKWHLGLTEPHWPEAQGFDVAWHGKPDPGPRNYFAPYQFPSGNYTEGPPGEYIVDRITDEAIAFMQANRDRPFFVNLWQYGVHGPWGHKEEYTREFAKKTDPTGRQGNPIMASMLKSVDESLGRIVAALDELGLSEQTIVIFTSDNGGNVHSNLPGDRREQRDKAGIADWRRWAGNQPPTNNAPLREGKSWLYEGGVRVPLIVAWPGKIPANTVTEQVACSIDFYPTLLDLLGIAPRDGLKFDGVSLAPVLRDPQQSPEREAVFNFFPHAAGLKPPGVTVRQGDWKLIRWFAPNREHPSKHELYNLREDLGETQNLAEKYPERVAALDALIDGFLRNTGALLPKPNPDYDPNRSAPVARAADPLGGWLPRSSKAEIKDGVVQLTGQGRFPFLGTVQTKTRGPAELRIRVRSTAGGAGKLQWRTSDQETFPEAGQVTEFHVPAGGWHVVQVPIPVEGTLVHTRLYLPAAQQTVEIDSIELWHTGGNSRLVKKWDF